MVGLVIGGLGSMHEVIGSNLSATIVLTNIKTLSPDCETCRSAHKHNSKAKYRHKYLNFDQ